jgi:hypothetical protein
LNAVIFLFDDGILAGHCEWKRGMVSNHDGDGGGAGGGADGASGDGCGGNGNGD